MGYVHKYYRLAIMLLIITAIFSCKKDDKDSTDPQIEFRFPPEYSILSDVEVVRVLAQDNDNVRSVLYMADGDTVGIEYIAPHTLLWNTTQYPDCTAVDSYISLTAVAEDYTGNTGMAERNYYVDNYGLPPVAVEMREPTNIGKHEGTLSWDLSEDYYFSHYVLYRDTASTVNASSDSIFSTTAMHENTFTDMGADVSFYGLLEDESYYYRVYVHDLYGLSTGSDSSVTLRTALPLPVTINSPPNKTKYTVTMSWSALESDVAYYRIHRGDSLSVTAMDSIDLTMPNQTTFTDTGLFADSLYHYTVYTIDDAGFTSPYDSAGTLSIRTDALPGPNINPTPLDVAKYSAMVGWDAVAQQEDSSWLELFVGVDGIIDTAGTPIMSIPNGATLTYSHNPISQGTNYSYILRHRDSRNNQKWSATLDLTTVSIDDVWNGALGRSSLQEKSDIELHWDGYDYVIENDFASYTITRDNVTVFSTNDKSEIQYNDTGLQRNTAYNYELTIADTSGATIQDSSVFSTRDIYTANLVDIYVAEEWDFHLAWEPSAEPIGEFGYYAIYRTDDAEVTFEDADRSDFPDCVDSGECEEAGQVTTRDPAAGDTALVFVDADPALVRLWSYYYSVLTYDSNGEYAASNIIGDTLFINPSPVTVEIPDSSVTTTSLRLIWTEASWGSPEANAAAFHSYEVWRNDVADEIPGALESSYQRLNIESDITKTTFKNGGLIPGGEYYYTIVLRDLFGLSAASEEVFGVTSPN